MEKSNYMVLAGSINEKLFKSLSIQAMPLKGGQFMIARMSQDDVESALRWPMERLESWSSPLRPYDNGSSEEDGFYIFLAGSTNEKLFKELSIHAMPLEGGSFMIARMSKHDINRALHCQMERPESWTSPLLPFDEMHSF